MATYLMVAGGLTFIIGIGTLTRDWADSKADKWLLGGSFLIGVASLLRIWER